MLKVTKHKAYFEMRELNVMGSVNDFSPPELLEFLVAKILEHHKTICVYGNCIILSAMLREQNLSLEAL